MMDRFVSDLTELWKEVGLELKPRATAASTNSNRTKGNENGAIAEVMYCPQGGKTCEYCQKPLLFEKLEARVRQDSYDIMDMDEHDKAIMQLSTGCQKPNCPQLVSAAA